MPAQLEPFEKNKSFLRWPILALGSFMLFCSYYAFDIPSAIKPQLFEYLGSPSDFEIKFSLLYTIYAAPNVVLPFFGGYLVDSVGVRFCLLLYISLICIGQLVFALGVQFKTWPIMFLGRLIFGFGGESYSVAVSALLSEWFRGRELAFSFGINFALCKLGTVINNIVSQTLTKQVSITFALWFGLIMCGVSALCAVCAVPIDYAVDQRIHSQYTQHSAVAKHEIEMADLVANDNECCPPIEEGDEEEENEEQGEFEEEAEFHPATLQDILHLPNVLWVLVGAIFVVYGCILPFNNISSSLLLERDYFKEPDSACHLQDIYQCQSDFNLPVHCPASNAYQPPLPYNTTVGGVVYSPLQASDIDCSNDDWKEGCMKEYCSRQTAAYGKSSVAMSIPYIITAAASPVLGFFIDRYGLRAVIVLTAGVLLVITHSLLGYSEVSNILPLVLQGLSYGLFAAVVWPSIPLVVEERFTGLSFGIATSVLNLSCAITPLIVASIYADSGNEYIPDVEVLFIALAAAGIVVGVYMNYFDAVYGNHILNGAYVYSAETDDPDSAADLSKHSASVHSASSLPVPPPASPVQSQDVRVDVASASSERPKRVGFAVSDEEAGKEHLVAGAGESDVEGGFLVGTGGATDDSAKETPTRDRGMSSGQSPSRDRGMSSGQSPSRDRGMSSGGSGRVRNRSRSGSTPQTRPRGASFTVYGELYRGGALRSVPSRGDMLSTSGKSGRSGRVNRLKSSSIPEPVETEER